MPYVAETDKRSDDGSENISSQSEYGGCGAGVCAAFIHGQGVADGKYHAHREDHRQKRGLVCPEVIYEKERAGLYGCREHHDPSSGPCGLFEHFETKREHGACSGEEGVEAHEQTEFQL